MEGWEMAHDILFPANISHKEAVNYGNENEPVARAQLEGELGQAVQSCGLFVDTKTGYLAASPDSIIDDEVSEWLT